MKLTDVVPNPDKIYQYTYDYRTRRIVRDESATGGGETTKVIFSGGTSIREIEDNTPTVDYIRGSDWGGGVGGILYSLRDDTPSYSHNNSRGDIIARTGPTGLLNEGFRYRDLDTGSFITRDPLGFVDGPNLYAYVSQNPWTYFDPSGLQMGGKDLNAEFEELAQSSRELNETPDRQAEDHLAQVKHRKELNVENVQTLTDMTDTLAGMNPAIAAYEAGSGYSATGQKLSGSQQALSALSLIPVGKVAGAIKSVAKSHAASESIEIALKTAAKIE